MLILYKYCFTKRNQILKGEQVKRQTPLQNLTFWFVFHPPLLFWGLASLSLLFVTLFSQPIPFSLLRGAWRLKQVKENKYKFRNFSFNAGLWNEKWKCLLHKNQVIRASNILPASSRRTMLHCKLKSVVVRITIRDACCVISILVEQLLSRLKRAKVKPKFFKSVVGNPC